MQKLTAGPYGQRTKINYRKSIAQYIVFVKNLETIYSYAGVCDTMMCDKGK